MTDENMLAGGVQLVSTAVVEFDRVAAGLASLQAKFAGATYDVAVPGGMADARAARQEIRAPRYEIEKVRKAAKSPLLHLGRQLDAKAKEITEALLELEQPIDNAIKDQEAKAEAERRARELAELRRVSDIQAVIQGVRDEVDAAVRGAEGTTEIVTRIERLAELEVTEEAFQEFTQQAEDVRTATLARLTDLRNRAAERERDEAVRREERKELERLRSEAAARDEAERKRREEAEAAARAEREAAVRAEREKLAAEQQKLKEERVRVAVERQALALERERDEMTDIIAGLRAQGTEGKVLAQETIARVPPTSDELVALIEREYCVSTDIAAGWLWDVCNELVSA